MDKAVWGCAELWQRIPIRRHFFSQGAISVSYPINTSKSTEIPIRMHQNIPEVCKDSHVFLSSGYSFSLAPFRTQNRSAEAHRKNRRFGIRPAQRNVAVHFRTSSADIHRFFPLFVHFGRIFSVFARAIRIPLPRAGFKRFSRFLKISSVFSRDANLFS